jgi:regulatory protein
MSGIITALRVQKRATKRINVYLDGAYAFPLDLEVALDAGLKRGMELSDAEIARLRAGDDVEKAYDRALGFLSYRPRSTAEVRRSLTTKGVAPQVIEQVLERLTRNRLLDDANFARLWVENREAFSPRSSWLLGQELRQKGLTADDITAALPEGEAADASNEANAAQAAGRKARSLRHLEHEAFLHKLIPFLQRRGFGYEVAREAAETAWRESHEPSS